MPPLTSMALWLTSWRACERDFAKRRVRGGMPAGSFIASGMLGQRIVIAPAERLVVVRFGRSMNFPTFDIQGAMRLVADANAAVQNR